MRFSYLMKWLDENSNIYISIVCNNNCINTGKINKMSAGELFHVILFSSNQAATKIFLPHKSGTTVHLLTYVCMCAYIYLAMAGYFIYI